MLIIISTFNNNYGINYIILVHSELIGTFLTIEEYFVKGLFHKSYLIHV